MNKALTNGGFQGFTLGLLIGGPIGAVAAIWLAPQSGKKMQEMIRRRAHQLQREAEGVGHDIQIGAQHASVEIRERIAEAQHDGKEWLEHQSDAAGKNTTNPVERVKR